MLLARLLEGNDRQATAGSLLRTVSLNVKRYGRRQRRPEPRPEFQVEGGGTLKLTLTYNKEIQTNAGVFNLWIDSACNLQRLCLDTLPFNITVAFRTPRFHLPGQEESQSQLHRLRDAVAETHMHFLHGWLPSKANGDESANVTGAVHHREEPLPDGRGCDVLTLELRKLAETKTIAGDIDRFRQLLRTWQRYNEDRDFEGDYAPRVPGKP
jgi:hypothetical protein